MLMAPVPKAAVDEDSDFRPAEEQVAATSAVEREWGIDAVSEAAPMED